MKQKLFRLKLSDGDVTTSRLLTEQEFKFEFQDSGLLIYWLNNGIKLSISECKRSPLLKTKKQRS